MENKSGIAPPTISIPKGGGAIQGIGEKFQPDLHTGTGNFSIPIATSPGRNGFGPQLSLQYSTGKGNGPFGLGWDLSVPRITRKTEKGLPKYDKGGEDDVFVLSGAEDLVPVLDEENNPVIITNRSPYTIYRYRPRIEGLFSRIERWVREDHDKKDTHWRMITKDNITNIYGRTPGARIFDPENPNHIFEWLLQETFDDKGNHILYEYARDSKQNDQQQGNLFASKIYENNRTYCQLYLRRIYYGNLPQPLLDESGTPVLYDNGEEINVERVGTNLENRLTTTTRRYAFEVIFDYFDLSDNLEYKPPPDNKQELFPVDFQNEITFTETASLSSSTTATTTKRIPPTRPDPFSSFRAGFEIRTLRLCRSVMMFHHFKELGGPTLVRSTDFKYKTNKDNKISFLSSVTVQGYRKKSRTDGTYLSKKMPPTTFQYTEFNPHKQHYQSVDAKSSSGDLPPKALHDPNYALIDIFGDAIPDVLQTTDAGYYFWENTGKGQLDRRHTQHQMPAGLQLSDSNVAFGDMGGDGLADLIITSPTMAGFFEATPEGSWKPFKKFEKVPSLLTSLSEPNLRLVDLTGDGLSDILVTLDHHFLWYQSLGEKGYDNPQALPRIHNLEEFPDVYFNDPSGRVRLADMTGDGLNDIVMIHNGRIDYWPNLGYGKFGKKITMADAPLLEYDFDPKRLFLADLDGTGCADIVYIDFNQIHFWFNHSGNGWSSKKNTIDGTPFVTELTSVQFADFFGTGTTSLVWSYDYGTTSVMDGHYKVLDFCGRKKPYLLYEMNNNMGATTRVQYAPSTKFYLEDKKNDKPWITNLPFPVLVLEKSETIDHISRTKLVSTYKYHHGYYDGEEREFRGFGRVDQYDTEEFDIFANSSILNDDEEEEENEDNKPLFDNNKREYHVPPVLTKTWFHTGAYHFFGGFDNDYDDADIITSHQLAHEYYGAPKKYDSDYEQKFEEFVKTKLLPDTILPESVLTSGVSEPWILSFEEKREASRSLRGSILRQEVYALDGSPQHENPYTVSERNYDIKLLQPLVGSIGNGGGEKRKTRHAVFFTHPREQIDFQYERNPNDPRISHSLVLDVDVFGNVKRSVSVGYGRLSPDPDLDTDYQKKQGQTLITYTENRFTNKDTPIDDADNWRTPLQWGTKTYEITGITPAQGHFFEISEIDPDIINTASDLGYHESTTDGVFEKRLIEHVTTRFRKNKLNGASPFGDVESMALPFETYNMAFTPDLITDVYGAHRVTDAILLDADKGKYIHLDEYGDTENWWIPSGKIYFKENPLDSNDELAFAKTHFFTARMFEDPFGNSTIINYDVYDLLVKETKDALDNVTSATTKDLANGTSDIVTLDYQTLQPWLVTDPNGNRSSVIFDELGMVVGTVVMGKVEEPDGNPKGDLAQSFVELSETDLTDFFDDPNESLASNLLGSATSRILYNLSSFYDSSQYSDLPIFSATLVRQTHQSDLRVGEQSRVQVSFSYSDGFGREIQKKIPAEPGNVSGVSVARRWVGSGWVIFNNKGNPVNQFEPFFSNTHKFEFAKEAKSGVSPTIFYDPVGRVISTLYPNNTYYKVVFDAWHQRTYDVTDTVTQVPSIDNDIKGFVGDYVSSLVPSWESWYDKRKDGALGAEELDAAKKAEKHDNTPTISYFDAVGHTFLTKEQNRTNGVDNPPYYTQTIFDIEGNQREIIDAKKRIVMRYQYDMLGNRIKQESMEAGTRWMLNDVAGKPIRSWDSRGFTRKITYDKLQRPLDLFVTDKDGNEILAEKTTYGESITTQKPEDTNHRLKVWKVNDAAGLLVNESYDFKGNLIWNKRQLLVSDYKTTANWKQNLQLEQESFASKTMYDALNRPIQIVAPHSSNPAKKIHIIQPSYNEANLLEKIDGWLEQDQNTEPTSLLDSNTATDNFVRNIDYNARGQYTLVEYGIDTAGGVQNKYEYDENTFRLIHLETLKGGEGGQHKQDLHYTYDPVGNITKLQNNSNEQPQNFVGGKKMSRDNDYVYDAIYRLVKASGREHLGQVDGTLRPPTPTKHDDSFWTTHGINDIKAMGRYDETYVYDDVGNITDIIHRGVDPSHPGWSRKFFYLEDSLTESGGSKKSNRLSMTRDSSGGITQADYGYDEHGNMNMSNPHLTVIQWDYKDQLQATSKQTVTAPGAKPVTTYYVYDSAGQRVRKVTESEVTESGAQAGQTPRRTKERIYLGIFEVYREYKSDGIETKFERETLHISDGKSKIALVENRTEGDDGSLEKAIRYQFTNHLGSSVLELDKNGAEISYEEYYPYGSTSYQGVRSQIEVSPKRYRYTAKEKDEESGLYYYGKRYYAPWFNRWISADPIGIADGLNLYHFVHNNPINLRDLKGNNTVPKRLPPTPSPPPSRFPPLKLAPPPTPSPSLPPSAPLTLSRLVSVGGLAILAIATTIYANVKAVENLSGIYDLLKIEEQIEINQIYRNNFVKIMYENGEIDDDEYHSYLNTGNLVLKERIKVTIGDIQIKSEIENTGTSSTAKETSLGLSKYDVPRGAKHQRGEGLRRGPRSGKLKGHHANIRTIGTDGKTIDTWREVSGEMTPEQKDMKGREGQNSSHTESKGLSRDEVMAADVEVIKKTGHKPPCTHCRGEMKQASEKSGKKIIYQWRGKDESGKTTTGKWSPERGFYQLGTRN